MKTKRAKSRAKLNLDPLRPFFLTFIGKKDFHKVVLSHLKQMNASEALVQQAQQKLKDQKESDKKAKSLKIELTTDHGSRILFYALNELSTFDKHTTLRKSLCSDFENLKRASVFVDVKDVNKSDQIVYLEALASLLMISQWQAPKVTQEKQDKKEFDVVFESHTSLTDAELQKTVEQGAVLGRATNLVRTLSDMPANRLTPSSYLQIIKKRSKDLKYQVRFLDRKALEKLKAGAFLAVTQGNLQDDGGIAHLSYKPKNKSKKLILVGKGLCFDTGGYNIKTRQMYGMQKDMTGSAIALAVLECIIQLKLPFEVHAFLGLAENLVSHRAYKPSDVVTASDGTSIEVTDTDAEGRMVLADVLALARKEGGDLILDFATLTGSVIQALDTRRAGVYSNRPKFLASAFEVGEACGERVWGFPIGDDYRDQLKSGVADILQCRIAPGADHIYAATFLSHFVGDEIPWIHMDLAASECTGGLGLVPSQSSGFGVRWALNIAKELL